MKRATIIFSVLAVFTIFITVFSNIKANEVSKVQAFSQEQKHAAEQAIAAAMEVEAKAVNELKSLEAEVRELESQLANCQ